MNTYLSYDIECAVCHFVSTYYYLSHTKWKMPRDLDSRVNGIARNTLNTDVQLCPSCGYASKDIGDVERNVSELIRSSTYMKQLNNSEYPRLANVFLCAAMLYQYCGQKIETVDVLRNAAYVCDDENYEKGAILCRRRTIPIINHILEEYLCYSSGEDYYHLLLTDFARRVGYFNKAKEYAERALKLADHDLQNDILRFQLELISKKDVRLHNTWEMNKG